MNYAALVEFACEDCAIVPPTLDIGMKGLCGGSYNPNTHHIRINVAADYNTVIHEVAHAVDQKRYGARKDSRGRYIHHDSKFRKIMREIAHKLHERDFLTAEQYAKLDTSTTHSLDLKPARKMRQWAYECRCPDNITISTVIHNRIQKKGQTRVCRTCNFHFSKKHFLREITK